MTTDKRKSIFTWNHISNKLSKDQTNELKSYYKTYHKKQWCYKVAFKNLRKWKLAGDILSLVFGVGGIAATAGVALISISTLLIVIQTYMKHKNLEKKIDQCQYAFTTYGHLLNEIKDMLRSGEFDTQEFYSKLQHYNDFILDNSPIEDKYSAKYDLLYSQD